MAKQQGLGVVAAARRVSDTQGKFQDVGGRFMTGYNKSLEAKKAKEKESEEALARVNTLMDGFTNDIDVLKFKPEDQTVVKNKITEWRGQYAEAANAAAKIKDKSSAEYQQYVDIMNGVQNKMVKLKNNIDSLAAFKGEYAENVKAGTYSVAGQNAMSLAQGETMVTSPISSITDDGDLEWAAGVGSVRDGFSFEDYKMPFAKANGVATSLNAIATPLTTMKNPLTQFEKDYVEEQVENLVGNDPDVLASIIADGELKAFNFTDIDPYDPKAKDIVVDRLIQGMYDIRGSRVEKPSVSDDPSNPAGSRLTLTNVQWGDQARKISKTQNAVFETKAPNGDYVKIIPAGVEYGGFAKNEPMMQVIRTYDKKGNPIYALVTLEQGLQLTYKRN